MRVVIDTNIWVSGLLWKGLPWLVLRLAEERRIELCIVPSMLDELFRVLSYDRLQHRLDELELTPTELTLYAMNLATVFDPPAGSETIVAADPDDDVFLRCAKGAAAVYVVSGDNHLLDLGTHAGIPIVTIREFLEREFPEYVEDQ